VGSELERPCQELGLPKAEGPVRVLVLNEADHHVFRAQAAVPVQVGDEQSVTDDSFSRGLLDFPQYTRPAEIAFRSGEQERPDLKVPDVLLSGNHAEIRRWRKREALARTLARRPDLLASAALDDEERRILGELQDGRIAGLQEGKVKSGKP